MSLTAFLDKFTPGTLAGGSTVPRTGYGAGLKAGLIWGGGSTSAADAVGGGPGIFSFGFFTSPTERRVISYRSDDGTAAGDSAASSRSTAVTDLIGVDGVSTALLDVNSMPDADGWTGIIDDSYSTSRYYTCLGIGGSDVTNVKIITVTANTSGATQAITGVGFQADSAIVLGASLTSETGAAHGRFCLGIVGGVNASDNACLAGVSQDGADPTVTKSYCRRGESFVGFNTSGALDGRGYISAFDSDGGTLTWNSNPSDAKIFYVLFIKGGRFSVGDVLTQTDTTTDIVESGVAFQPVAGLLLSAGKAESAAGTLDNGLNMSIGAFTSDSAEGAQAMRDNHNVATSQVAVAVDYASSYLNISSSDTLDGEGHITAVNSDGYTARMTNADPSQAFVAHLLFGSAAAGGSIIPKIMHHRRMMQNA